LNPSFVQLESSVPWAKAEFAEFVDAASVA
jgi:hypothetical protein